MPGLRLAVLVSGSGTNLQTVIDAAQTGFLKSEIACVISNKASAYGLVRAKESAIPSYFIEGKRDDYDEVLLQTLQENQVDLIVLAGYLKIVDTTLLQAYKGRVINIHPSLLPKYGGKGYYGLHVHTAVVAAKETESGATVHYVDEGIDTGQIILQESVPVQVDDTPETLQKRILDEVEHHLLVDAIKKLEEEMA